MPKTNITSHSRSIRRVAIDGHFLDDVQIRLHSDESSKSLSYSSAPVERHHATEDEGGTRLRSIGESRESRSRPGRNPSSGVA